MLTMHDCPRDTWQHETGKENNMRFHDLTVGQKARIVALTGGKSLILLKLGVDNLSIRDKTASVFTLLSSGNGGFAGCGLAAGGRGD